MGLSQNGGTSQSSGVPLVSFSNHSKKGTGTIKIQTYSNGSKGDPRVEECSLPRVALAKPIEKTPGPTLNEVLQRILSALPDLDLLPKVNTFWRLKGTMKETQKGIARRKVS